MEKNNRTINTVKNIGANFGLYILTYIAVFISRTFFVKLLGNEYLSLNGLFSNLITIISFSELGLGTASIYCLYKPIAEKNYIQIHSYLKYFHKLYRVVIFISAIVALLLIPTIPYIIDINTLSISYGQIVLYYCLFCVNTISTYFFVESKLFLIADQKNYIANTLQQIIHIVQLVFQTIYLVYSKDFIGYLVIQIFSTFITNIVIHLYVKNKYCEIYKYKVVEIETKEKKKLTSNIRSIFCYKIGAVILNGTDNIIISSFVKTALVGICSNYLLVINAINSILMQCFNGIGASIGNHIITADKSEHEKVFRQLNLLCVIAYMFSSICLYVLLNPLINIWLGSEYLLDTNAMIVLILVFFITGVNQIPSLYRTSIGLFKKVRFLPILAAISNIILSILFAKEVGLWGIFAATIIVRLLFFTLVDPVMLYRYGFEISPTKYYILYIRDFVFLILGCVSVAYVCDFIEGISFKYFFAKIIVCIITSISLIVLLYNTTSEFKGLKSRLLTLFYEKNK